MASAPGRARPEVSLVLTEKSHPCQTGGSDGVNDPREVNSIRAPTVRPAAAVPAHISPNFIGQNCIGPQLPRPELLGQNCIGQYCNADCRGLAWICSRPDACCNGCPLARLRLGRSPHPPELSFRPEQVPRSMASNRRFNVRPMCDVGRHWASRWAWREPPLRRPVVEEGGLA